MNVAVEEVSPCRRKLTIEVPKEKVVEAYHALLEEYMRQARVKGFRPGKAPASIVAKRYKKQIQEELQDQLVPAGYREALQQEQLNPVAVIDVEKDEVRPDAAYTFAVTCDVAPAIELPSYRGLVLASDRREVEEADIDQAIAGIMDRFARFEDSEGPIENGDLVQIDFEGRIGDQVVSEAASEMEGMGKGTDFWMQAGPQAFLADIGNAVIGAQPGDRRSVDVTFGEDFTVEAVRGRQAVYDVEVKAVRTKVTPELEEGHLKDLGVESEGELRDRVREDLERQVEMKEHRQLRDQAVRMLLEGTSFELPASVVEDETRNTIYEMVRNITRQGASEDQIRDRKDELFDVASRNAEENVRSRFILAAIAQQEGIMAEPADVEERLRYMAARYQMPLDELRSELKTRNQLVNVEQDVRFDKTLDFLIQHAEISRRT